MCKIDIANQINNPWNKDSVLALAGKTIKFGIKLTKAEKKQLFDDFISEDKLHNRKVVAMIHAFLVFKCLYRNKISSVEICPDCRPTKLIYNYLQKIGAVSGFPDLTQKINIKFKSSKSGKGKYSTAHKYANFILRNYKKEDYRLGKKDMEDLREHINKRL